MSAGLVSSEASLLGLQTDGGGRVNQGAAHTRPFRQRERSDFLFGVITLASLRRHRREQRGRGGQCVSSSERRGLFCLGVRSTDDALPWWSSDWKSACQFGGHGFNPWYGRIPHTMGHLDLCATTTEPMHCSY